MVRFISDVKLDGSHTPSRSSLMKLFHASSDGGDMKAKCMPLKEEHRTSVFSSAVTDSHSWQKCQRPKLNSEQ